MKASAKKIRDESEVTPSHANTIKRGCAGQAFGPEFEKRQFSKTVAEIWQVHENHETDLHSTRGSQKNQTRVKDTPATSAQPARTTRSNLTLSDWLTVFAYVDAHQAEPEVSRAETLRLCQRLEGACLQFRNTDPTLPLELLKQIRLFRAHLRRDELLHGT